MPANDNHTRVYPPSMNIIYPEGTEIHARPFTLGEVDYIFEHNHRVSDILNYVKKRDIVICKGIEFDDITTDHWGFLELTLVAMTFPKTEYKMTAGNCPTCKANGKVKRISYNISPTEMKEIIVDPILKLTVVPSNIVFDELDDIVEIPITADLSFGPANLDFYRIKHLLDDLSTYGEHRPEVKDQAGIIIDEGNEGPPLISKMGAMCDHDPDELSVDDGIIMTNALNLMFHGANDLFNIQCPVCSKEYPIHTSWEVADFIPFRTNIRSTGTGIHFGKIQKPTNRRHAEPELPKAKGSVHKDDRRPQRKQGLTKVRVKKEIPGS